MENDGNVILGIFRKCSICNKDVMCSINKDSIPETHNKECREALKNGNYHK